MIESAMITRYIDALFRLKAGGSFVANAAEMIRELGDPEVSAPELLTEIDSHPATHFEIHLRRLVRGDQ